MKTTPPASFRLRFTHGYTDLCASCHAVLHRDGVLPCAEEGEESISLAGWKRTVPAPDGAQCDGCLSADPELYGEAEDAAPELVEDEQPSNAVRRGRSYVDADAPMRRPYFL